MERPYCAKTTLREAKMRETFLRKTKMRESEFLDTVLHDLKIFHRYLILASPRMIEKKICPVGVCYTIL